MATETQCVSELVCCLTCVFSSPLFSACLLASQVRVPLKSLRPTRFANVVDNQTLQKSNIVGLQFVYSKFEYDGKLNPKFAAGDVNVQILEIKAY